MEQETQTNKDLALVLFSGEGAGGSDSEEPQSVAEIESAAQGTFGKLNQYLSRRLGSGGYQALLKRAVALAAARFPRLASVCVTEEGGLEETAPVSEAQTSAERAEGYVAILASLIGLLETFIGRALCLSVLHAVWPDAVQINTGDSRGDSDG